MRFSLSLPLIALCWAVGCLLWPPPAARGIAPGAQAESISGLRDAAIWSRLVTAFGPARAEPGQLGRATGFYCGFSRRTGGLCRCAGF